MNAPRFRDSDRNTLYLMPPSVQDWLPENHLARFVVDVVSELDLWTIENAYGGRGSDAYPPRILVALLFYGYATGVFSSRKLEAATHDSVAFRFITANTHPDHDTIASFRKRFVEPLQELFSQILLIAHGMGIWKLGNVALDGTKVKANASKHKALSWEYACRLEQQIKVEVAELFHKAEQADTQEIPDELARREKRLQSIAEVKEEIQRRACEQYAQEKEAYEKKMAHRKVKEQNSGKKPRGRSPKPPELGPQKKDQVNLTDQESRIMPTSGGSFHQAYNAQAGVDMDSLLIVESHVTQDPNDKQQIEPALHHLTDLPNTIGSVEALVADAGYFSESNVQRCEAEHVTPYIAGEREKHNPPLEERFS